MIDKPKVLSPRDVFMKAIQIEDSDKREAFLQSVYAGDEERIRIVNDLLEADESMETAKAHAAASSGDFPGTVAHIDATEHPTNVGPYKIIEKLGEGGMGDVYMALQDKPIRRTVAVKIIKPGMDSRQVLARFEAERQALAIMDHPYIARIYDADQTDSGRLYFAMELVKGRPITEFCGEQKIQLRDRLRLFVKVCEAIQHAHTKGVIHRDLKPANVLVELHDVKAIPKVIDFGIAKATGQQLTDRTLQTGFSQLVGTPLYMSPEQAQLSGLDVDTRSDVYSLGVLLYELLTGSTPFDRERMRKASFDDVRRIIQEEEAPRPSQLVSTIKSEADNTMVSEINGVDIEVYARNLRSELDWIVLKCLEKDRSRRYESVSALSSDIGRFLQGRDVLACPPTWSYRAKKTYQRHRSAVLVTALLTSAFLIAGIFGWWQAAKATKSAIQSERDRALAEAINGFLADDILAKANPWKDTAESVTLLSALDLAAEGLKDRFVEQPEVEAELRHVIGEAYKGVGDGEAAEIQLRKSIAIYTRLGLDLNLNCLKAQRLLAGVLFDQAHFSKSENLLRRVIPQQSQLLGPNHEETLRSRSNLALVQLRTGHISDAEVSLRELLQICNSQLGPTHDLANAVRANLAMALVRQNKKEEAEELLQTAVSNDLKKYGAKHPRYLTTLALLADSKRSRHPAESTRMLFDVLQGFEEKLGSDHQRTINARVDYANTMLDAGELASAKEIYETVVKTMDKLGRNTPKKIQCLNNLGSIAARLGRFNEALTYVESAAAEQEQIFGSDHPNLLVIKANVANLLRETGKLKDARSLATELATRCTQQIGRLDDTTLMAKQTLSETLIAMNDWEAFERNQLDLIASYEERYGPLTPQVLNARNNLMVALVRHMEREDEGIELLLDLVPQFSQVYGETNERTLGILNELALATWRSNRKEEGIKYLEQLIERGRRTERQPEERLADLEDLLRTWQRELALTDNADERNGGSLEP